MSFINDKALGHSPSYDPNAGRPIGYLEMSLEGECWPARHGSSGGWPRKDVGRPGPGLPPKEIPRGGIAQAPAYGALSTADEENNVAPEDRVSGRGHAFTLGHEERACTSLEYESPLGPDPMIKHFRGVGVGHTAKGRDGAWEVYGGAEAFYLATPQVNGRSMSGLQDQPRQTSPKTLATRGQPRVTQRSAPSGHGTYGRRRRLG